MIKENGQNILIELPHFHDEFDYVKDKLDCFVPSPGKFKCGGENATPGKKKRKKKAGHVIAPPVPVPEIPASTPESEASKEESNEKTSIKKKKAPVAKNGCGRNWGSNKCLTKFVCSIEEKNILLVEVREYGQRCEHCTKRYENPSFLDE